MVHGGSPSEHSQGYPICEMLRDGKKGRLRNDMGYKWRYSTLKKGLMSKKKD
jgi:hypothetical protein